MTEISQHILEKASESLLEKLISNFESIKNYLKDRYTFQQAQKNFLDRIVKLEYVKTINAFEQTISLYEFFVKPTIVDVSDNKDIVVDCLDDIKASKKILILGIVGQGKSILMRHLAINEVLNNKKIPIFIECRYLDKGQSVEKLIKDNIKDWLNIENDKLVQEILKKGSVTVFLDGFDEISIEDMPKVERELEKIDRKFPDLKFIVSSRPEDIIEACPVFQSFKMKRLDSNAQKEIVSALVKDPEMQVDVINGINESTVEVKEALVTPLMMNLFVFIYKKEQLLPENVKDFYDRLFDLILRKHDNTKINFKRDRKSKLKNDELKKVFRLISYMCCRKQSFVFNESEFIKLTEKAIKHLDLQCGPHDLIYDLTTVLCFIAKEGYLYVFIHKSIPEFFAAEYIAFHGDNTPLFEDLVENYKKYKNICSFLNYIDEYQYFKYFLKDITVNSLMVFQKKDFINDAFFLLLESELRVIIRFRENIHDYYRIEFLGEIVGVLRKDANISFGKPKRVIVTVSSVNNKKRTPSLENDGVVDNASKEYYDIIDDDVTGESKRIKTKDLLQQIESEGYKKINKISSKNKFYHSIIKFNTYVEDLRLRMKNIDRVINTYKQDDYDF